MCPTRRTSEYNPWSTTFVIKLWTFIRLTAPPLVSPCVFKDDVDESTTYHQKNVGWYNNLEHLEKIEECRVHDTNHKGFNHNGLNGSLHLLLTKIIFQYMFISYTKKVTLFIYTIPGLEGVDKVTNTGLSEGAPMTAT